MPPSSVGSACLDALCELLGSYPAGAVQVNRRGLAVDVVPVGDDTFPITVYDEGDQAMIAAGRWHTHYDDPMEVAYCVMWLLTPFYRLVEELKGGVLVATWIERYEADGWQGFEPVYFLNPEDALSWERVGDETFHRRYTQQAVLMPPVAYAEVEPEATLDAEGFPPDAHLGRRLEEVSEPLGPSLL